MDTARIVAGETEGFTAFVELDRMIIVTATIIKMKYDGTP
jgi:hypothetical protein